jgi:hypothetical protein
MLDRTPTEPGLTRARYHRRAGLSILPEFPETMLSAQRVAFSREAAKNADVRMLNMAGRLVGCNASLGGRCSEVRRTNASHGSESPRARTGAPCGAIPNDSIASSIGRRACPQRAIRPRRGLRAGGPRPADAEMPPKHSAMRSRFTISIWSALAA